MLKIQPFPVADIYNNLATSEKQDAFFSDVEAGKYDAFNSQYESFYDQNASLLNLSCEQGRIAGDLRSQGYCVSHFNLLFPSVWEKQLEILRAFYHKQLSNAGGSNGSNKEREWMKHVLYNYKFENRALNDFILSDEIIFPVIHYMRQLPRFIGFNMLQHVQDTRQERTNHQRWHRDYHAIKGVKVFIYLNDVSSQNGAFQYVPYSHASGALGRDIYSIGTKKYLSTEELPKDAECLFLEGAAGTIIFADTYGFHRGGRCERGHRDMALIGFSTNLSVSGDFSGDISSAHFSPDHEYKRNIVLGYGAD